MKMSRISSGLLLLIALCVFIMDTSVNAQNWPMINLNRERTSWASDETVLYPPLQKINEIPIKSTGDYLSLNYLTFYNNLLALAVGRYPNTLEAVDIASGDTLWTFEVPYSKGSMNFVCAQNDSIIFAGGQQGLGLYALDRETGDPKWSKPIGSLYTRSVIIDSLFAYILGDSLYCISIKDGSTIWSQNINVQSTPAVDDLYVYVVGIYKIQIYDKLTGELLWWRTISERTTGGIVVDNDCFYSQSNDTIFAYNKESWDVKWIYESQGDTIQYEVQNSIAITDNKLCFTIRGNGDGNGELVTLDKETGGFLWAYTFSGNYVYAPAIANGVVYIIPSSESALYGFDLENGTQLFSDNSFSYRDQPIVANHQLFVETPNKVIVFENAGTQIDELNEAFPQVFGLMQNYPNPFNPSTTIKFNLPKTSTVTLKIFNILGEAVALLVSENLSAGSYSYEWDASNLPSGLYLYRLEAQGFVETKKMILMK
jgi:outer membrane protein assembly factor BamB